VRGFSVARNRRPAAVVGPWRTAAPAVAARAIRGFHRGHHAIGDRAGRVNEGLHGIRHDATRPQDVALDRIEDLGAGHLSLHVLRHVTVGQTRVAGAASLQIDDAELPALIRRILAEQVDDVFRIGALLQRLKHEHLILMCVVDRRLACGDAFAGHDHRLHALQEVVVSIHAGGRRDDDPGRRAIDSDDRPGGGRRRRDGEDREHDGRANHSPSLPERRSRSRQAM